MTDVLTTATGTTVPVPTLVQCDQATIVGDGSHGNPLRAGHAAGGLGFVASPLTPDLPLGSPVTILSQAGPGGLPVVGIPAVLPDPFSPSTGEAYGIISAVLGDGTVRVAVLGTVVLTIAEWDAVTGQSGGLSASLAYFAVSPDGSTLPYLGTTPPVQAGAFQSKVGVALSPTTLLVLTSAPRVAEEGQTLSGLTFVSLVLGNAVVASAPGQFALASTASVTAAQAVGVVAAFDAIARPVVQLEGALALTTGQWDAVTGGSGGLSSGHAYYVSATPGHLTSTVPTTGPKVQVGVALSPTVLVVGTPYLQTT